MATNPIKRIAGGVKYSSEAQMCEAYGIEVATYRYRVKVKGYDVMEALTKPLSAEEQAKRRMFSTCPCCADRCMETEYTLPVNGLNLFFCSEKCISYYTSDPVVRAMMKRGEPLGRKIGRPRKKKAGRPQDS